MNTKIERTVLLTALALGAIGLWLATSAEYIVTTETHPSVTVASKLFESTWHYKTGGVESITLIMLKPVGNAPDSPTKQVVVTFSFDQVLSWAETNELGAINGVRAMAIARMAQQQNSITNWINILAKYADTNNAWMFQPTPAQVEP